MTYYTSISRLDYCVSDFFILIVLDFLITDLPSGLFICSKLVLLNLNGQSDMLLRCLIAGIFNI